MLSSSKTNGSLAKLKSSTASLKYASNDKLPAESSSVAALKVKSNLLAKLSQKISTGNIRMLDSIYKIKQKSHEEIDIEIQSSRVLYVLDELITNLEIIALVPVLLENDEKLLYKYLPAKDADFVLLACQPYLQTVEEETEEVASSRPSIISESFTLQRFMSVDSRHESREKAKPPSPIKSGRGDLKVQQAVATLCESENLRKNLHSSKDFDVDILSGLLIDGVKRLRNVAEQKLSISANEERERERELRKAWKENAEAKVLIQSIQERLDTQHEKLDVELNAKNEQISFYKEKIEAIQKKFKEDIKKRITNSEKSMIQKTQESEEKQAHLQQDAKEITHTYWVLLDQHIASEKVLRAKRYKVEAQLHSWLTKYDQDIGEKQSELENLQKLYDEEQVELNALQKQFDDQEEEYLELTAERDEYERKEYAAKAYQLLINRCARKIQRYWRAYRERKRRRKKKGKKKDKGSASGDSGGGSAKKGKGKGKKDTKHKAPLTATRKEDPNIKLEEKFKDHVFEDIDTAIDFS